MRTCTFLAALILMMATVVVPVRAQEDVADVTSEELKAGGDEKKRYFLIGAKEKGPEGGYGLLVVLPGGDGGAEVNPFMKRVWKNALPEGWLVAQMVAVPSDDP